MGRSFKRGNTLPWRLIDYKRLLDLGRKFIKQYFLVTLVTYPIWQKIKPISSLHGNAPLVINNNQCKHPGGSRVIVQGICSELYIHNCIPRYTEVHKSIQKYTKVYKHIQMYAVTSMCIMLQLY